MKTKMSSYFILFVLLFAIGCGGNKDLLTLTDKKPKTLPAFTFYDMNDVEYTEKDLDADKGYVLMYLDPDCIFCQTAIQRFTRNLDDFEDVEFLVISSHSKRSVDQFIELHSLNEYDQIRVVRDPDRQFPRLFYSENYPVLYLYNKERKYLASFQGLADIDEVEKAFDTDY